MLKIIKYILYPILALLGIGFFLPGSTRLERVTDINAPDSLVFNQINELKNWQNWSPWFQVDPKAGYSYSDPSTGQGAYFTWESQNSKLGTGKTSILSAEANKLVHTKTVMNGFGELMGDFKLMVKDSAHTNLTWTFDMDYGANPILRWIGLTMGKATGGDYDKGLARLKEVCEKEK